MKTKYLILLLFLVAESVNSQHILTLQECYEKSYSTAPIMVENNMYSEIWQLKDKNHSKAWLPVLDAGGSFVYNSSVVNMTDALGSLLDPGIAGLIRPLPNEQYKVTLDISQTLYDGGALKVARALEKIDLGINLMQTESDLYKLREAVNNCYFNLLLMERQKELVQNYLELINKRMISMNSAMEGGIRLKSDMDVLLSERIKLEQQLSENKMTKASLRKILSDLTGIEINDSTELILPSPENDYQAGFTRPELQIFDLRKEQLDLSLQALQSKRMPKAFAFATLGYGNPPGNNFFKDEFAPYYIAGTGIKWNIFDWNRVRNEKQMIYLQQGIIDSRKRDMTDKLTRLLDAKSAEISNLESLLKTDTELIEIRRRITLTAESQYENGTITATDYLNELNSEKQAQINYEIHKINLALARVEYLNISGKEIE